MFLDVPWCILMFIGFFAKSGTTPHETSRNDGRNPPRIQDGSLPSVFQGGNLQCSPPRDAGNERSHAKKRGHHLMTYPYFSIHLWYFSCTFWDVSKEFNHNCPANCISIFRKAQLLLTLCDPTNYLILNQLRTLVSHELHPGSHFFSPVGFRTIILVGLYHHPKGATIFWMMEVNQGIVIYLYNKSYLNTHFIYGISSVLHLSNLYCSCK